MVAEFKGRLLLLGHPGQLPHEGVRHGDGDQALLSTMFHRHTFMIHRPRPGDVVRHESVCHKGTLRRWEGRLVFPVDNE